jgi:ParB-like nuclease domain
MARFHLASARAAAAEGRIAVWVGEFLASPGSNNATLAAGLAQTPHRWLGPVRLPLADLIRLAGPERDAVVHVAPQRWTDDVEAMESSLDEGWEPPPLLAEYLDGRFLLQDGNHRYEALARAGARDAWVLVYFDDAVALDDVLARAGGSPTEAG